MLPSHYLNQCWLIINWTLSNKLLTIKFESKYNNFHSREIHKCCLQNVSHFVVASMCYCMTLTCQQGRHITACIIMVMDERWKSGQVNRWMQVTRIAIRVHSSPPRQNGRYFPDDIFRWIFMNENYCILIRISLKLVPKVPIDNNPVLV